MLGDKPLVLMLNVTMKSGLTVVLSGVPLNLFVNVKVVLLVLMLLLLLMLG
jgi:hypothetical protein